MQSKNIEELLSLFRKKCKEHGLSMTPQRLAIYKALIESKNHPSAENIFNQIRASFPDIALDTIYRNLSTFSDVGIIHLVEGYVEAKRYDPNTKPHHHFRCTKCNRLLDLHTDSFGKLKVPHKIKKKYNISNIKIVLEGECDGCFKKN
jgi:Fur family peroxide stress response transcriptional regulator